MSRELAASFVLSSLARTARRSCCVWRKFYFSSFRVGFFRLDFVLDDHFILLLIELRFLIFELCFRFRWHDAGTYDVNTKTGGPNGSIRNEEEYAHGANNGLKIALEFCGEFWFVFNICF